MNPQQPQSLLVGSDLDDHVSGWFLRETGGKDTRLSHCISPFDTVHITLSIFGQVKIFRDFPKQREKRVLFIRFSPSFSIPPCCTVYGSLLSKAMGKEDRGTEERNFMWILPSNHICWGTFAPLLTPPSFQESYLLSFFAGHVSRGLYLGSTGIEQQKLWGKKVPTPI